MCRNQNSQKRWILVGMSILASLLILPSLAQAQKILFEDTFDKSKDKLNGTGKWHTASGSWVIKDGRLVQNQRNGKNLILVSDGHWNEEWNDYWFYSTIKLAAGHSPLIIWRFHSDEGAGFAAKDAFAASDAREFTPSCHLLGTEQGGKKIRCGSAYTAYCERI